MSYIFLGHSIENVLKLNGLHYQYKSLSIIVVSRLKCTIYKHMSDKNNKYQSIGNFEILSHTYILYYDTYVTKCGKIVRLINKSL